MMRIQEVTFTEHFKTQFRTKGFTPAQVREAIENPYKVTPVTRYPGQMRHCGGGIAVVMRGTTAITVYLDGVVTPMRKDQENDAHAMRSHRLKRY